MDLSRNGLKVEEGQRSQRVLTPLQSGFLWWQGLWFTLNFGLYLR